MLTPARTQTHSNTLQTVNTQGYLSTVRSCAESGSRTLGNPLTKSHSKNKKSTVSGKLTVAEKQKHNQSTRRYLYALQKTAADLLRGERVCVCSHCRADSTRNAYFKSTTRTVTDKSGQSSKVTKAELKNVFVCGDVWVCAVCGKKIFYQRGKEIKKAIDAHATNGKALSMLTLTVPHTKDDDLADLLNKLKDAKKRFFGDRSMREVLDFYKVIGHITNTEVTHGWGNGWHPHHHICLFADYDFTKFMSDTIAVLPKFDKQGGLSYLYVDNKREQRLIRQGKGHLIEQVTLEHFLKIQWAKFCRAVGLGQTNYKHGLTLQDGSKASEYISKFQTAMEITDSMNKKGRKGNRNQWEILHDAMLGCEQSKALFVEYATAFHGKRQLVWSRGLKDLFGINEITDDEILEANEVDENADNEVVELKYLDIDYSHWLVISRNRLVPHIEEMIEDEKLGIHFACDYINKHFGKGVSIVVDSYDALRQYDRQGNLISGDIVAVEQSMPKHNPYPSGTPSYEWWQSRYGLQQGCELVAY